ncbi:MAG: hypothetical protein AB7T27_00190 [Kiritimatiellia bacterium]
MALWHEFFKNLATDINQYQGLFIVLFTFVLILLNRSLVRETRRLREKETEPNIEIYLIPAHGLPVINMVVRNTGGPARGVKWKIDADLDDLKLHNAYIAEMELFTSLSYFPSNERLEFFFGFAPDLFKDPPLKAITIAVTYKNEYSKNKTYKIFEIDVRQFRGTVTAGSDPARDIARHLDSIQKYLGNIASGFSKPHVLTQNMEDFRRKQIKDIKKQQRSIDRTKQAPSKGRQTAAATPVAVYPETQP